MIFLVRTARRCGSTWLVRVLDGMARSPEQYVDGLEMRFSLAKPRGPGAVNRLAGSLQERPGIRVFKTHDVPAADFDAVCATMPELRVLVPAARRRRINAPSTSRDLSEQG